MNDTGLRPWGKRINWSWKMEPYEILESKKELIDSVNYNRDHLVLRIPFPRELFLVPEYQAKWTIKLDTKKCRKHSTKCKACLLRTQWLHLHIQKSRYNIYERFWLWSRSHYYIGTECRLPVHELWQYKEVLYILEQELLSIVMTLTEYKS